MSDFSAFDNALRSLESIPLARVAGRFALSVAIFIVVASEMCASGFNPFIYFQF